MIDSIVFAIGEPIIFLFSLFFGPMTWIRLIWRGGWKSHNADEYFGYSGFTIFLFWTWPRAAMLALVVLVVLNVMSLPWTKQKYASLKHRFEKWWKPEHAFVGNYRDAAPKKTRVEVPVELPVDEELPHRYQRLKDEV